MTELNNKTWLIQDYNKIHLIIILKKYSKGFIIFYCFGFFTLIYIYSKEDTYLFLL